MLEFTEPLKSGAKLPDHPADTTARKVIKYGKVYDAHDKHELTAGGLHESDISSLMSGNLALSHLYCYAIRNQRIIHTRPRVIIAVETEDADPE